MRRIIVDTSVLIPAFNANHAHHVVCASAIRAILDDPKKKLLVPAPVVAEFRRGDKEAILPIKRLVVVHLDMRAAERAGTYCPQRRPPTYEAARQCIQQDAMIAGCAYATQADEILTLDENARGIYSAICPDVEIVSPEKYQPKQGSLFLT